MNRRLAALLRRSTRNDHQRLVEILNTGAIFGAVKGGWNGELCGGWRNPEGGGNEHPAARFCSIPRREHEGKDCRYDLVRDWWPQ